MARRHKADTKTFQEETYVEQSKTIRMKKLGIIIFVVFLMPVAYVFGQTAEIQNGGQFRVIEVKEVISEISYIQPDENMRFVAFDLLIDNTNGKSDIKLGYISGNFEVRDTNGYSFTPIGWSISLVKPDLDTNANIEQGELLRGWVTIQIHVDTPLNGLRIRINTRNLQSSWVTIKN